MLYRLALVKRMIEDAFIFPFVLWGRWRAGKKTLGEEYEIFFFFPFYHVGGAEKVHASIARVFSNKKAIIYFTRKSHNDFFLPAFQASGHRIVDISGATGNKWKYFQNLYFRGLVSGYINRQKKRPIVMNGQCNFAYKLSRWIRAEIPQIELIHSLNSFSFIRIPFLPFIESTIMISRRRIEDHFQLYEKWGIPGTYKERIHYIPNGIDLPSYPVQKSLSDPVLKILYAGRATPEKRVHWVASLAKACHDLKLPVQFIFMGETKAAIPEPLHQYGQFLGNIGDEKLIADVYSRTQILILSSSTEGFPMVVEEAMAFGCAILATPVGDIPLHVLEGKNGYLFSEEVDETQFVKEGIQFIRILAENRELLEYISQNNMAYARDHFGFEKFSRSYRDLFTEVEKHLQKINSAKPEN